MSPRVRTGVIAAGVVALFVLGLGVFILPFAYPTPPPIVSRFTATRIFSPNDDMRREVARVSVRLVVRSHVSLLVRDGDGNVVKTLADEPRRRGWVRVSWEGRTDAGDPAPDGSYRLELRVKSGKKNFRVSRRIVIDREPPTPTAVQVSSAVVAGPGPGECRLTVTAGDGGSLTLEALRATGGRALARLGPRPIKGGETVRWAWDGSADIGGPVRPGLYRMRATISDTTGNRGTQEQNCWVGHLIGQPNPAAPAPGARVGVRLSDPAGQPLDPGTRVTLTLHRRLGTPGTDLVAPLGPRVGGTATGSVSTVSVRLPVRLAPETLWLVAATSSGRALIPLAPSP